MTNGKFRERAPNIGPDVVLYHEDGPEAISIVNTVNSDLRQRPDCLLIMGTRLQIPGVKDIVRSFADTVHDQGGRVAIVNRRLSVIDHWVKEDCDDWVRDFTMGSTPGNPIDLTSDGD